MMESIRKSIEATEEQDNKILAVPGDLESSLQAAFVSGQTSPDTSRELFKVANMGLEESLSNRQHILIAERNKRIEFRRGTSLDEAENEKIKGWLSNDEFWNEMEMPSRQARRDALDQILNVLTSEQTQMLRTIIIDDELLQGAAMRNDLLYFQLT